MSEDFRTDVDFSKLFTDPEAFMDELEAVGAEVMDIRQTIIEEVGDESEDMAEGLEETYGQEVTAAQSYEHVRRDLIKGLSRLHIVGAALPDHRRDVISVIQQASTYMAMLEYRQRGGVKR